MRVLPVVLLAAFVAAALPLPAAAQDVTDSATGVKFAASQDGMQLLGTGLRTKTFLKVKVYVIGLYVSDAVLAGDLAKYKGKTTSPEFYKDIVWGDYGKEVVMKFVRDLSADQIRGAFRETLEKADKAKVETFVGYFGDLKVGAEYVLRWNPGTGLEVTVGGQAKPPINDKNFAAAVFGIWLGDKPIQDDIKAGLVSRAASIIK